MGANWSNMSPTEVGDAVSKIGSAFEPYREICIANGIDGEAALDLEDDELAEYGVNMKGHRKALLRKIAAEGGGSTASSSSSSSSS